MGTIVPAHSSIGRRFRMAYKLNIVLSRLRCYKSNFLSIQLRSQSTNGTMYSLFASYTRRGASMCVCVCRCRVHFTHILRWLPSRNKQCAQQQQKTAIQASHQITTSVPCSVYLSHIYEWTMPKMLRNWEISKFAHHRLSHTHAHTLPMVVPVPMLLLYFTIIIRHNYLFARKRITQKWMDITKRNNDLVLLLPSTFELSSRLRFEIRHRNYETEQEY